MKSAADLTNQVRGGSRVAAIGLHAHAIVSLLNDTDETPMTIQTTPETLLFDCVPLAGCKKEFLSLVCARTTLAVAMSTKSAPIIDAVTAAIDTMEPGAAIEVDTLPPAIAARIQTAIQPGAPIRELFRGRFDAFLRHAIVNGAPATIHDIMPTTAVAPTPKGFQERVGTLIKRVCRIATINREVHLDTYNAMMLGGGV